MEGSAKEETQRIVRKLRTALRLLGFTNREIERRLGYTPSYLSRLFSGQIELRFEHIVDIARAMGLTADEFFAFAYPPRSAPPSEGARELTEILEDIKPTPSWEDPSKRLTEELMTPEWQRLFAEAIEKSLASEDRKGEPERPARTKRHKG